MITNDPARAREFVSGRLEGGVIRKAFRNIAEAPRTTAMLEPADLDRMPQVRFAPVTFQEFVPAEVDVRVIVVENKIFATAIRSQPQCRTDDRAGIGSAEFRAHRLPDDVADKLPALHKRLGLMYGASDLRLTPDGRYVFLEVNPAGEFLFACETHALLASFRMGTTIGFAVLPGVLSRLQGKLCRSSGPAGPGKLEDTGLTPDPPQLTEFFDGTAPILAGATPGRPPAELPHTTARCSCC